jgi:hypothetical protein
MVRLLALYCGGTRIDAALHRFEREGTTCRHEPPATPPVGSFVSGVLYE